MIHAITATWAFDEAYKREATPLRCSCGNEQLASKRHVNTAIACKNCGTPIPTDVSGDIQHAQKNETK
jgi:predicted SprT family Zn-dependent metalloprotease